MLAGNGRSHKGKKGDKQKGNKDYALLDVNHGKSTSIPKKKEDKVEEGEIEINFKKKNRQNTRQMSGDNLSSDKDEEEIGLTVGLNKKEETKKAKKNTNRQNSGQSSILYTQTLGIE